MSQVLEQLIKQENKQQQHQKLWQIMDDIVKTNKYKQTKYMYVKSSNNKYRCAIGALVGGDNAVDFIEKRDEFFDRHNIIGYGEDYEPVISKEHGIRLLKHQYATTGKMHRYYITVLNDGFDMPFAEFRDLFYEMGV